ncbi:P-loop containing nucleoside triphosphate hydrolase protein [Crepidotus variabilis]|uniref:Gluconokinase n=1 Tax=Crepidotus variabilis TaxID=179855 RepID=A0A9P6E6N5_9AGAR|nr:P-loop containing nucleoside triphosphate hydrolase protein [Crepidotus variabilis]
MDVQSSIHPNEDIAKVNHDTSLKYLFVVVMGVSGTGKTTLGSALSKALDIPYVEGDALHPRENVEKMSNGHPLTDGDRQPWLELIRKTAVRYTIESPIEARSDKKLVGVVISCSALKRSYRELLRGRVDSLPLPDPVPSDISTPSWKVPQLQTCFVYIKGSRDLILKRMEARVGHYMKASMLDTQLAVLESPEGEDGVIVVDNEASTNDQVKIALEGLKSFVGEGLF